MSGEFQMHIGDSAAPRLRAHVDTRSPISGSGSGWVFGRDETEAGNDYLPRGVTTGIVAFLRKSRAKQVPNTSFGRMQVSSVHRPLLS